MRIVAYRLIVDECPGSLSRAVTEAAGKGWVPHEVASWHPRVGWWQAVVRHEERAGKRERMVYPVAARGELTSLADLEPAVI